MRSLCSLWPKKDWEGGMKAMKRKLKVAGIFGVCWFGLMVGLVDGVLGFERVKEWCGGSWAEAEAALWGAVVGVVLGGLFYWVLGVEGSLLPICAAVLLMVPSWLRR